MITECPEEGCSAGVSALVPGQVRRGQVRERPAVITPPSR